MSTRRLPATIGLCAWTLLIWITRIRNIWTDDELTTGQQWARTGLALSFTVLALAVGHAMYHRASWRRPVVRALAAWTTGVWAVRAFAIATGDHDGPFIAVHLVLAAISITLAGLAAREVAGWPASVGERAPPQPEANRS